jgi:hypothetical protein
MLGNKKLFFISIIFFVFAIISISIQFTVTYGKPLALYSAILTVICSTISLITAIGSIIINQNRSKIRFRVILIIINIITLLLMIGNIYFLFRYRAGNLYI